MNERIRELAEQAGITTNLETDYFEKDTSKWVDYYSEKFAELIVRDVCKILEGENIIHGGYGYNQYPLHDKIKQHFGINDDKPVDDDLWYWSIK